MWEAIRNNRRRSMVLISAMAVLMTATGAAAGYVAAMEEGALFGAVAALALWGVLTLTAMAGGDALILKSVNARKIEKGDAPQLWNVVEEMTIASGLGKMPDVYVIDDDSMNAFAVGRRQDKASVAFTAGLLKRLNRDELQGVAGHEIGHIRNLDVRFMTLASVMLGVVVLISDSFVRAMYHGGLRRGGSSRSSRSGKGGDGGRAAVLLLMLVFIILAPIAARLLYFACSREREYLADASAAVYTRYPKGLASALAALARPANRMKRVSKALTPLFIVNPLQSRAMFGLFSTHPPVETRIAVLNAMGGANFAEYEKAFQAAVGRKCLDSRTLSEDKPLELRRPSAEVADREAAVNRAREVNDFFNAKAGFASVTCECGMRFKIPPGFRREAIQCPRCNRPNPVPTTA